MLNLIKLSEEAIYPDGTITTDFKATCVMERKVNQFLKDWEDQLYGKETC